MHSIFPPSLLLFPLAAAAAAFGILYAYRRRARLAFFLEAAVYVVAAQVRLASWKKSEAEGRRVIVNGRARERDEHEFLCE